VAYRLSVTNPTSIAVAHVTVCDGLPTVLVFVAAHPAARLGVGRRQADLAPAERVRRRLGPVGARRGRRAPTDRARGLLSGRHGASLPVGVSVEERDGKEFPG